MIWEILGHEKHLGLVLRLTVVPTERDDGFVSVASTERAERHAFANHGRRHEGVATSDPRHVVQVQNATLCQTSGVVAPTDERPVPTVSEQDTAVSSSRWRRFPARRDGAPLVVYQIERVHVVENFRLRGASENHQRLGSPERGRVIRPGFRERLLVRALDSFPRVRGHVQDPGVV